VRPSVNQEHPPGLFEGAALPTSVEQRTSDSLITRQDRWISTAYVVMIATGTGFLSTTLALWLFGV
jgi:hypothetical protein